MLMPLRTGHYRTGSRDGINIKSSGDTWQLIKTNLIALLLAAAVSAPLAGLEQTFNLITNHLNECPCANTFPNNLYAISMESYSLFFRTLVIPAYLVSVIFEPFDNNRIDVLTSRTVNVALFFLFAASIVAYLHIPDTTAKVVLFAVFVVFLALVLISKFLWAIYRSEATTSTSQSKANLKHSKRNKPLRITIAIALAVFITPPIRQANSELLSQFKPNPPTVSDSRRPGQTVSNTPTYNKTTHLTANEIGGHR